MGVEARFQAIPEDCELLKRARQDRRIAELMSFLNDFATGYGYTETSSEIYFEQSVIALIGSHPGLEGRYFYAGGRNFDKIIYLLSPQRRPKAGFENDSSLINKAIMGSEKLHPEAYAGQGWPIGYVPGSDVQIIAEYLNAITFEQLHEHYNPAEMWETGVYKQPDPAHLAKQEYKLNPNFDEEEFKYIWGEFTGVQDIYRKTAAHHEAMITVIN